MWRKDDAPTAEGRMIMKGCKNCPAFSKCTVTYRGSACAALRYTYGLEDDPEIKTNADRIRAMTDEELAHFLAWHWNKKDYGLEWLKQPAE